MLRALRSVGNREHVLSCFAARTRTIIRLTRPMRLIRPQVEDLIEIYQGRGFSRRCLVQIAHRLLKSVGFRDENIGRPRLLAHSGPRVAHLLSLFSLSFSLSLSLSLSVSLCLSLSLSVSLCLSLSLSLSLSLFLSLSLSPSLSPLGNFLM